MTDGDLTDWNENTFQTLFTHADCNLNGTIDKKGMTEVLKKMTDFHKKMNNKHFNLMASL